MELGKVIQYHKGRYHWACFLIIFTPPSMCVCAPLSFMYLQPNSDKGNKKDKHMEHSQDKFLNLHRVATLHAIERH